MRFEIYSTLNGNVVVGDAEDEGAPLLTLSFSNEWERSHTSRAVTPRRPGQSTAAPCSTETSKHERRDE